MELLSVVSLYSMSCSRSASPRSTNSQAGTQPLANQLNTCYAVSMIKEQPMTDNAIDAYLEREWMIHESWVESQFEEWLLTVTDDEVSTTA